MNEYDTELVRSILTQAGYSFANEESEADIILLNTCSVRENAHRKVFGKIHSIHHERRPPKGRDLAKQSLADKKPVIIGVLGCMATSLKEDLLNDKSLNIDFIVGPDSYKKLPDIIGHTRGQFTEAHSIHHTCGKFTETPDSIQQTSTELGGKSSIGQTSDQLGKERGFDITLSEYETYSDIAPKRESGINAWIAIMRGCNNFCSFCIVPYVRGRERSRSVDSVVDETKKLVQEGFQQVTLLGQNVNSYKSDSADFATLIEKVGQVEGIKRIRFMSPNPKDFPDRLLEVMANNPKICKHIHLPFQSGNTRVLKLMNRHYSKEDFLSLVDKIKSKIPQIALTTDIIVGFPTETDKEFEDTIDIVKKVRFDSAFIFKYSVRQGTLAAKKYVDDIPEETKTKRIVLLNEIQKQIAWEQNQSAIGKTLEVLIEREELSESNQKVHGRSDGNKIVILPKGNYHINQFVKAKITSATPHLLKGETLQ